MRILIAPTAFKGSLSPAAVARAMEQGVKNFTAQYNVDISTDLLPLADGGDGSISSLHAACGGSLKELEVQGAFGEVRKAQYLILGSSAIVELASACGISGHSKADLNPLGTHTFGLGQVIAAASESAAIERTIIMLGGSASTDGGAGALAALAVQFFNQKNEPFVPRGGDDLSNISSVDLGACLLKYSRHKFLIACDVENPLLGRNGAAAVFAPQKGADESQVAILDEKLAYYADILEAACRRSARAIPGAGAAGGTAFGLSLALNADIVSGFDTLAELMNLRSRLSSCDLIFTAEGQIDSSSLQGKAVGSLSKWAAEAGKKIWAFAASMPDENIRALSKHFDLLCSIVKPGDFADADAISACVFSNLQHMFSNQPGSLP